MRNVSQSVRFCIIQPWKDAAFPDLLLFFLNDSGNCISSLGSHIFLSHIGKIQPFLTLSQLNHTLSSSIPRHNHTSSFSGFCACNLVSLLSGINSAPFLAHHFHPLLFYEHLSSVSPLHQTQFLSSPSASFTTCLQSSLSAVVLPALSSVTFSNRCVSAFSPPPHHSWAVLSRNICKENRVQHSTACSLLLEGFICHVSSYT